jgi:hypothetical protein
MAQQCRLVKYYNLPRYIDILRNSTFPFDKCLITRATPYGYVWNCGNYTGKKSPLIFQTNQFGDGSKPTISIIWRHKHSLSSYDLGYQLGNRISTQFAISFSRCLARLVPAAQLPLSLRAVGNDVAAKKSAVDTDGGGDPREDRKINPVWWGSSVFFPPLTGDIPYITRLYMDI